MAKEKSVNAPPAKTNGPQQTALAAPSNFSLSAGAPAWLQDKMKGQPAKGLEAADRDDFIYPRLVLAQALTPDVAEGKCRPGDVLDNITRDVLFPQGTAIEFVPVVLSKSRFYMKGLDEGGGILCRSLDSLEAQPGGCGKDQGGQLTRECNECVFKEWDDSTADSKDRTNGAPKCTLFYNILGFLPTLGNRVTVWSGKATNVKVIRRFLSTCKQTGADFWAHKFDLNVVDEQSTQFRYKNWSFSQKGWVTEAEYNFGAKIFKDLSGKTWGANTSDLEASDTPNPPSEQAPF